MHLMFNRPLGTEMRLYELLQDRAAINVLKALYDTEVEQRSYSINMAVLQQRFSAFGSIPAATQRLLSTGLVGADEVNGDVVVSITARGKRFIEIFDQLSAALNGRPKPPNGMALQYELVPIERQMLALAERIPQQNGKRASLHTIAKELYPQEIPAKKIALLKRHADQLQQLGLAQCSQVARNFFVTVTENGRRALESPYPI